MDEEMKILKEGIVEIEKRLSTMSTSDPNYLKLRLDLIRLIDTASKIEQNKEKATAAELDYKAKILQIWLGFAATMILGIGNQALRCYDFDRGLKFEESGIFTTRSFTEFRQLAKMSLSEKMDWARS